MKKIYLTSVVFSMICSNAYAALCTSGYSLPSGYTSSAGYTTLANAKTNAYVNSNRLYYHPDDCDNDVDNDKSFQIEAVPCSGGDKTFNEILRSAMGMKQLTQSNGNWVGDSTSLNSVGSIFNNMLTDIQSNSNSRHCDSAIDYYTPQNRLVSNAQYCDLNSGSLKINIASDAFAQGLPADETNCYVTLEKRLKVGQTVVLNNVTHNIAGEEDYYTMGYATVSCGTHAQTGEPTLFIEQNDPSTCDLSDINFYDETKAQSNCNQICFWAENLHCPSVELSWGANCRATVGQGYVGDIKNLSSDKYGTSGSADFQCGLGGQWFVLGTPSCL